MTINISEKAREQLSQMGVGKEGFLRISVIPGGCSGHTYTAAVDSTMQDNDQVVYEEETFKVIADTTSAMHLSGLSIDYSEDLIQSGFRFSNPNAAKACGCGSSFQL